MAAARPVRDLPEKLRATASLLRCKGQKELCAAFRRLNPATEFDLDRSYRWMQGRTVPRAAGVYEDWARLLGLAESGEWLAASSLSEFLDALDRAAGDAETRRRIQALRATTLAPRVPEEGQGGFLVGDYAAYSHAQSPYFRGRLIRGSLRIEPAPRKAAGFVATYEQALPIGRARASGTVRVFGNSLCLELRDPGESLSPVFIALYHPNPPASLLAGMLCGVTAVDPNGQPPYTTRVVLVRVRAPVLLAGSNSYLPAGRDAVAEDLHGLGLPDPGIGPAIQALLDAPADRPGSDRVEGRDYAALKALCDRQWLAMA